MNEAHMWKSGEEKQAMVNMNIYIDCKYQMLSLISNSNLLVHIHSTPPTPLLLWLIDLLWVKLLHLFSALFKSVGQLAASHKW